MPSACVWSRLCCTRQSQHTRHAHAVSQADKRPRCDASSASRYLLPVYALCVHCKPVTHLTLSAAQQVEYDAALNARYWSRRPVAVLARALEIGAPPLLAFGARRPTHSACQRVWPAPGAPLRPPLRPRPCTPDGAHTRRRHGVLGLVCGAEAWRRHGAPAGAAGAWGRVRRWATRAAAHAAPRAALTHCAHAPGGAPAGDTDEPGAGVCEDRPGARARRLHVAVLLAWSTCLWAWLRTYGLPLALCSAATKQAIREGNVLASREPGEHAARDSYLGAWLTRLAPCMLAGRTRRVASLSAASEAAPGRRQPDAGVPTCSPAAQQEPDR
jgi:hypothetical protein